MEDYCSEFEFITTCRFFTAGQQQQCKGYMRRSDKQSKQCAHFKIMGGDLYHCDNIDAQAAAINEFKLTHMEKQDD